MKTPFISKYITFIVSILGLFFYLSCTENITSVDDRNTLKITGVIRNSDGTPEKSVSVHLYPSDFNPYTDISIDSTVSDSAGRYSFSLHSAGLYNLYVNSKQGFSFEGAIPVTENEGLVERECILKAPGSVSGTVNLRQCDDNKNAIILVLGTSTYAMPNDSTGSFLIPALAEGTYRIRVLSLTKGYGYYDSTIIVKSAEKIELAETINLSYGVPDIGEVKAVYDKCFMRTSLSWHVKDTSNIRSFYIFRNSSVAETPLAVISNACTTFVDDVLLPNPSFDKNANILHYTIAACGRDGSLGHSYRVPDILRRSVFMAEDTVNLANSGCRELGPDNLFTVDGNRNIFIGGYGWINKVDSSGRFCAEYLFQDKSGYSVNYSYHKVESDVNGNVYYLIDSTLMKFSPDLTVSKICHVNTVDWNYIKVDPFGNVYHFIQKYGATVVNEHNTACSYLQVTSFDSSLSPIEFVDRANFDTTETGFKFEVDDIHNGRIVFKRDRSGFTYDFYTTNSIHFDIIQIWNVDELVRNAVPFPLANMEAINQIENGLMIVCGGTLVDTLQIKAFFVFNSYGTLIARFCTPNGDPSLINYEFDGIDRFYFYDRPSLLIYVSKLEL
jgi:hypothetical protein